MIRRWPLLLTLIVAVLFVVLAIPGSPLSSWLVRMVAGGGWNALPADRGRSEDLQPSPLVLRAAVGAMVSPERTFQDYNGLLTVIADRAGRRLELVQRKTYRELNDLIANGAVDLAWVCTGALPDLRERGAARILAVPVIGGRSEYRSYLIVGQSSAAVTIDDLRGAVFAFTDPLSLTGHKVMVDELGQRDETPESFFRESFFTHAHDNSIRAVREGLADAAAVDSLVYDYLADTTPDEISGTRVIWRSDPYPIPPLVVPSGMSDDQFAALQDTVLGLADDRGAQTFLNHLRIDRFDAGVPGVYSTE